MILTNSGNTLEYFIPNNMLNCNPSRTPVDTESKLGVGGDPVSDPTLYRSLAGYSELWLLILTRIGLGVPLLGDQLPDVKYRGVANVVAETCWLRNLLRELHTSLSYATLVYCDNVSAVYLSCNPVQHQRIKHIEIDIHFVRDLVVAGHVRVLHVPSRYQFGIFSQKGYLQHYLKSFDSV
ncbi:ribonuclease H-like domain-containing protein [Tanacetum coccineum]|uniref:Ribonuclease H-like domain-containing protein n=1 Tax=Tanacetum coccineum TaxID=301880 RepID=A0ABQ4XDG6_9ASTR